jgi:hypothetical protein
MIFILRQEFKAQYPLKSLPPAPAHETVLFRELLEKQMPYHHG